jgi:hypothetical protein
MSTPFEEYIVSLLQEVDASPGYLTVVEALLIN